MKPDKIEQENIFEIAKLRFKTVVAEVKANREVILRLPVESDIHGFIILMQPTLPTIN